jgi:hypothetical protein
MSGKARGTAADDIEINDINSAANIKPLSIRFLHILLASQI